MLLGHEVPAQRSGDQGPEEGDALLAPARGVERVEPHLATRSQADRPAAEPLGERAVLALGVDHDGAPAEEGLPGEVGLHEGRLAPSDLPDHERRGAGDGAPLVEHPRVEAEARAGVGVLADVDPAAAEAALAHEGVGGLQVGARQLVGRMARPRPHRRPRQSGRV